MSGKNISPRHGRVTLPESRAVFARQKGLLADDSIPNSLEAGKFFPRYESGLQDAIGTEDSVNGTPPADGKIASAGYAAAAILDEPRPDWQKHEVRSGEKLTVSWSYHAIHTTRRWNYFLTKPGWDSSQPLKRAHFEESPFYKVEYTLDPHWAHTVALTPPDPTVHEVLLPRREGYHVLLAVWEVANTGAAFYQVIDLQFAGTSEGQAPTAPQGLTASNVSKSTIGLSWLASTASSGSQIEKYTLYRDGVGHVVVNDQTELQYLDTQLQANTEYTYFISATDNLGRESLPSSILTVRTWSAEGDTPPPTAPANLHAMAKTETSVSLMWTGSTSSKGILYLVYRNGEEVARLPQRTLEFTDHGLAPGTAYRYVVKAIDTLGQYSPASNELNVSTEGTPGAPEWIEAGELYEVDDRVTYLGNVYKCTQRHTSNIGWKPTEAITLWTRVAS